MKHASFFSVAMLAYVGMSVNVSAAPQKVNLTTPYSCVTPSLSVQKVELLPFPAEPNVVSNHGTFSVVQSADWGLKRVLNQTFNVIDKSRLTKPSAVVAEGATFFEGFEGWDGSKDWIPAGWVDESKLGTTVDGQNGNWTWGANRGGGFYVLPFSGEVHMYITSAIQYAPETYELEFPSQDEWLIMPTVTPQEGDRLNFMLSYSPGWTLVDVDQAYGAPVIDDFTHRNTNLEVLVSVDDGENWSEIWNAIDDDVLINYTKEELLQTMRQPSWYCFALNIDEYIGKPVKFAFRYVGSAGFDMALDDITVGTMAPDASYVHQNLYFGPEVSTGASYPNATLTGAYQPTVFVNTSLIPAENEWEYDTYEGNTAVTQFSSDSDLQVEYPFCRVEYPTLNRQTAGGTASYQYGPWTIQDEEGNGFIQAGGSPEDYILTSEFFGTINYNFKDVTNYGYLPSNAGEGEEKWQAYGSTDAAVKGFATVIPYAGQSYALSAVYFTVYEIAGDLNLPITAEVRTVNADGGIGDVIASGEAVPSKNSSPYFLGGGETNIIEFRFTQKEGELVQSFVPTISSDIFVVLNIPEGLEITPICLASNISSPEYTNYYTVFEDGKLYPINNLMLADASKIIGGAFTFDISYTWLRTTDGDYRFDVPVAGGSKTFDMDSYYIPDAWALEDTEGALYDWVNYTANYDASARTLTLTFDVEPLPSGVNDRYTYVTVSNPGSSARFTIAQGDGSSVEGVETSAVVVTVADGNFVVKGSNASVVDVYNVAGQKVATAAVDGETVVNGQNLAKGMYILKFNDNTAIKVVK